MCSKLAMNWSHSEVVFGRLTARGNGVGLREQPIVPRCLSWCTLRRVSVASKATKASRTA